ncbi:MAG: hypothetical protein PWQ83_2032 [Thermosipho sp. (in: thermotogales)]|nr:hypothetical protein [Thermosipho sp. (in: thermotogales)]
MKKIKQLLKNNFIKSIILISGGTAFAQVINALFSPIITRIYSPEQYGVLTVYTSILGLLVIIGSLKYEMSIPIAKSDEVAINSLALSIIVLIVFSLFTSLFLFFFSDWFLGIFNANSLKSYSYLIPIGIFLAGMYNIVMQWAFRRKDYKSISKTKLTQSLAQNSIKLGLGLIGLGPVGLILGNIFGQSAGITTLSKKLRTTDRNLFKEVKFNSVKRAAKRYKNFPLFLAPSQVLNVSGTQLPPLLLSVLYGGSVVGFFGLANSIVSLPMTLIGNSVADVFYGEAASVGRGNPQRIKDLYNKLLKRLFLIGLIPLIILLTLGPFLFSFVFGEEWYEAGVYSQIIAFLVFFRLIFTPISRIYAVFERQKIAFFVDSLRVIFVTIAFLVPQLLNLNSYWAIGLYSIGMSFVYFVTYLVAQKILNEEIEKKASE